MRSTQPSALWHLRRLSPTFDEKMPEPLRSNAAKIIFWFWLTTAARTIACFEGADSAKMREPVVGGNRLLMVTQL